VKSTDSTFLSRDEVVHEDGDEPAQRNPSVHNPVVDDAVLRQSLGSVEGVVSIKEGWGPPKLQSSFHHYAPGC
jgi:hypothetical protein